MAEREEIRGYYVSIDGTRTFFDEVGEGRPVVCIHTAGSDSREYRYLLPLLARAGYRALAPDLPGHSRSYPVNWDLRRSLHDQAEFVLRFVEETCEGEKPVVMGCSIGGDITLDLLAHHSEAFAAAIPMEGASWTPTFANPAELERPSWMPGWQAMLERAAVSSLNRKATPEQVLELRWQHRGSQAAAVNDLRGWSMHDVRGKLGGARCPVLLIVGVEDFWLPVELARATAEELPDCDLQVLDGIGHYPMFEDPERIASLTVEFLRSKGL